MKKRVAKLLTVMMLAIMLISGVVKVYATETTNLKLKYDALQHMEMVAGGKVHMRLEVALKDGYCIDPVFTIKPLQDAPIKISNITTSNIEEQYTSLVFIDHKTYIALEYDVEISDYAKIGSYEYSITYEPKEMWEDYYEDVPLPGELVMDISVVSEKTPPQISVVSGSEVYCKAGDIVTIEFTIKNEGELQAMNTYLFADYYAYDSILIPAYTPLTQKLGNIYAGESQTMKLSYKVSEDAQTQRVKIPLSFTYKLSNGENILDSNSSIYLHIEGKPAPTATPTPTPTATPTPTPTATPTPTPVPDRIMVRLNNVTQSPSSPKAGEKLNVTFYLDNAGNVDVENVKVAATGLSSNGFEPLTSEPYQYVGNIPKGTKKKVELTLRVGKDIPEGLNSLNVQYSFDTEGDYGYETHTENVMLYILDVQNPEEGEVMVSRPKLMVSNFYTDLEEVKAGNVFDFTFEILNTNDSIDAKNIKVTVSGASNAFSVTAGGNSFFVSEIKARETAPITINLKASAAVTTGAYPINIRIEYEYEGMVATATYSGEVVEEEILLQVKENLRPSVENVYIGSWDTPMVNQPTTLSFEFYNMGKSTLNNTYVTMEGDFMLSNGSNSFYIGNIAAGMPEYIEFDVVPLVEGDAVGKMIIHMEDSNGDEVTMEKEFTAYVMGEMSWDSGYMDPGYMDPGYMDPGYMDPSMPVDGDNAQKPIMNLWLFLGIQAAILVIVIPVVRAIRLAVYRKKIKMEDSF